MPDTTNTVAGEPVVDDKGAIKDLHKSAIDFLERELGSGEDDITEQVRQVAEASMERVEAEFHENEETPEGEAKPDAAPKAEKRDAQGRFVKAGETGGEAPATPPAEPQKLKINWKGRPVEMPVDDVLRFAAMGFDYSQGMAALKEERRNVKGYGEYMQFLDENPAVAQAITDLVQTFKQTGVVPRLSLDDGADQMAVPPGVGELQARQAATERWIEEQNAAREADRRWRTFEALIEQDPEVKALRAASRTADSDPFMEKLVEATARDPNADPQAVFRLVATDALRWARALAPKAAPKPRPNPAERLTTMPDSRATGKPPAQPEAFTPDDLGTTTRNRATALLRQMGW